MNDFNFRLNTSAGRLPLLPDCGHPQPCGHALSSDKCRKSENKLLIVTDFSMLHLQENKLTTWLSLQIFTNNKEVCGRTFPVNSILWLAVCWVRLNIGYYQMSSYIKKTNTRIIQDIKFPTTSKEMHLIAMNNTFVIFVQKNCIQRKHPTITGIAILWPAAHHPWQKRMSWVRTFSFYDNN